MVRAPAHDTACRRGFFRAEISGTIDEKRTHHPAVRVDGKAGNRRRMSPTCYSNHLRFDIGDQLP